MSDLCYNCGDCHLPRPCTATLKQCDICKNAGHTYNFCPLGVRLKDPYYQYWALCHNCDTWHLPDPCKYQFYKCPRCEGLGHKEFFCPINPATRKLRTDDEDEKTGAKRQRTNGSDGNENGESQLVHPNVVSKIRTDAAYEILHLQGRGFPNNEIANHMARVAQPRNYPASGFVNDGNNVKGEQATNHNNEQQPYSNVTTGDVKSPGAAQMQSKAQGMPTPATPTTAMSFAQHGAVNEGVYAQMHERFNRGDLSQKPSSAFASPYTAPATSGIVPSNATHGVLAPHSNTAETNINNNNNYTSDANLEYILAKATAAMTRDQAPGGAPQANDFAVTADKTRFHTNPLQQNRVPAQQSQQNFTAVNDAENFVVIPNTEASPTPELNKNGEPKKKRGRKAKT